MDIVTSYSLFRGLCFFSSYVTIFFFSCDSTKLFLLLREGEGVGY